MTPIIDIVFLLIIFFLVVCRFIEAENFSVEVPDNCGNASVDERVSEQVVTLSVVESDDGGVEFAVNSEKLGVWEPGTVAADLGKLLDKSFEGVSVEQRVVTVRIDKDVEYGISQYALAGVACSSATDVKMAVLRGTATK